MREGLYAGSGVAIVRQHDGVEISSYLLYDGFSFRDQAISGRIIASNRQFEPLPWISI
jgi:hypothetical protein